MHKYLEIGKIINTHGIKGDVKIIPLTDDPSRFNKLKWVYIGDDNSIDKYDIRHVKFLDNTIIIRFKNIDDINQAGLLKGLYLKVDRSQAIKLPEDSYFICDLIGCSVFEESINKVLGIIKDIIQTGSNDVYVVRSEQGKEILIPALKTVVKKVSIEDKKIWVVLPEGLREYAL